MLVEYLLDGLRLLEKMILDAATGETVLNLTPRQVRQLIRETTNSASFFEKATRRDDVGRTSIVSQLERSTNQMANKLKELKEVMQTMLVVQTTRVKLCEFYEFLNHKTAECPSLQNEENADVNAVGGYQNYNKNQRPKFGLVANDFSCRQERVFSNNQVPNNPNPNQQQQDQLYRAPILPNER